MYAMDVRQTTTPIFSLAAHQGAVTGSCQCYHENERFIPLPLEIGLCFSSTVPGLLVTSSFDEMVKVWDIENGTPSFVAERQFQAVKSLPVRSHNRISAHLGKDQQLLG